MSYTRSKARNAPRKGTNGIPGGADPSLVHELRTMEYDRLARTLRPTHREWLAMRAAARQWGEKDPTPVEILTRRLGPDYRAGIDSLTGLIALTGGR